MTQETFNLIDAINREGLCNASFGFEQDIEDTSVHFGVKESVAINGHFVYVYKRKDDEFCFINEKECSKPDFIFEDKYGSEIFIWKLN